jgi:enoyl-CoA hydratase/carnithine racemase
MKTGLAADVGTLQRLPKIVGNDSLVRELVYSARKMPADEALSMGLVSRVFKDKTRYIWFSSLPITVFFIKEHVTFSQSTVKMKPETTYSYVLMSYLYLA